MSRKRNVTVAAVQMKCSTNVEENIAKADALDKEYRIAEAKLQRALVRLSVKE